MWHNTASSGEADKHSDHHPGASEQVQHPWPLPPTLEGSVPTLIPEASSDFQRTSEVVCADFYLSFAIHVAPPSATSCAGLCCAPFQFCEDVQAIFGKCTDPSHKPTRIPFSPITFGLPEVKPINTSPCHLSVSPCNMCLRISQDLLLS